MKCWLVPVPSEILKQWEFIIKSWKANYAFQKTLTRILYNYHRDAKSLVKHLLVSELSQRYGNLKNGMQYIKFRCSGYKKSPIFILPLFEQHLFKEDLSPLQTKGKVGRWYFKLPQSRWFFDRGNWSSQGARPFPQGLLIL